MTQRNLSGCSVIWSRRWRKTRFSTFKKHTLTMVWTRRKYRFRGCTIKEEQAPLTTDQIKRYSKFRHLAHEAKLVENTCTQGRMKQRNYRLAEKVLPPRHTLVLHCTIPASQKKATSRKSSLTNFGYIISCMFSLSSISNNNEKLNILLLVQNITSSVLPIVPRMPPAGNMKIA